LLRCSKRSLARNSSPTAVCGSEWVRFGVPAPEPVPAEVYVKKGIPWLNLRTGPGKEHLDVGDLHPGRGPIRVVEKQGDWFKGEVWFHGDYVAQAGSGLRD
jgi:hypothetical protein